jgi:hypothetical protein
MEVANTPAYHDTTTITAVIHSAAPGGRNWQLSDILMSDILMSVVAS